MPALPPEQWRRLAPLFDELLDQPAQAREDWLTGRADLPEADLGALRDLLAAHEAAGDSMDTPLPEKASRLVADSMADPLLGATVGAYKVAEEIGRGGMGVVYRGDRVDGTFEQSVVIKVLRLGIDSDDNRRRFLQERQILADLEHPSIVKLLDGGFTPDGRPYLVMNHVVGDPIDEHCDTRRMDVQARVRLFLGVIDAVANAHNHLVIHRDIKPANVWVDKESKVHLLDFGIAKMTDRGDEPALTSDQQRLMTPEYASPEQIGQRAVTTASDVYQLGVLLYQLLTGRYPYALSGRTPLEMERVIRETDPVAPTRAVTRPARGDEDSPAAPGSERPATEISARRGTTPGALRKILRGDLEVILLKALRKEPERRYHSARELGADLRRWLDGDRILARKDSPRYQAQRFVRRHPLAVTLLATFIVCAVGFGMFHVQRIRAERDLAELEAARRAEVSDFLVDLLRVPDPTQAAGREITARELIEVSLPRIEEDLSDTGTRMRLLKVVAEVARNLGLYDQAGPALAKRVEYAREVHGERSLEAADALIDVAELWRLARMHADALPAAQLGLEIRQELLPEDHLDVGRALRLVAMLHRDNREYETAEAMLREATVILERELPADDPRRTVVRSDLAYVLRTVGQVDEAEAIYRQILPVMRADAEDYRQSLPSVLNNLAYLLRGREEYAEAEALYREAIANNESYYGDAHPSTLMFRNNLAGVLANQEKHDEVEQELATIIGLQEHLNGPEHWRTASAYRALGYFQYQQGRPRESAEQLEIAHEKMTAALGDDHVWTGGVQLLLAVALRDTERRAEAAPLWRNALILVDTERGRQDNTVKSWLQLMETHMPQGDDDPWRSKLRQMTAPTK